MKSTPAIPMRTLLSKTSLHNLLALAALFACMGGAVQAAPVLNVSLGYEWAGTYSGGGVITSGTSWEVKNTYNTGLLTDLKYSDGVTTSPFSIQGTSGSPEFGFNPTIQLLDGGISTNSFYNPTSSFIIGGATVGQSYDLVLFGFNNTASTTYFKLDGVVKTTSSSQGTSFVDGVNYVMYSGVTPDSGGYFQFTFDFQEDSHGAGVDPEPTGSTTIAFNGFQLTAVPEPTTFALLGLALLGLVACRRR